jgi:starch synthase
MAARSAKTLTIKSTSEATKTTAARRSAKPLRILMIASEAQPFSKTGGLADVAGALPKALGRLGHDVTVITPRYRGVTDGPVAATLRLEVAGYRFAARLMRQDTGPGARVLLLDCPELYDRDGIYYDARGDFDDNPVRFAFLSAAAIEWASTQAPFDIIHSHDWQGGLASAYAQRLPGVSSVFTIHNLAYQGVFDKSWVTRLGLGWDAFTLNGYEFYDRLSFIKAGINLSHAITTVSPTYAEEIQRPEYGNGLDGVIRSRSHALTGILNGIDPDEWNPLHDRYLPAPFSSADLAGKEAAKRALLEAFGFDVTAELMMRPVIGMVSRMVDQKGLDLIAALAGELPTLGATFVVVGTGAPHYQEMWRTLASRHGDRISAFIGFDERRAHLVEGGSDMFMMPSQFEPCGLNQMYSQRYGTVPIVRAVGGLVDTVRPYNSRTGQGTGFVFAEYDPRAFLETLRAAIGVFANKKRWTRLQKSGMRVDFSWDRSASEYVKMYKRLRPRRAPGPQQTSAGRNRSRRTASKA